MCNKGITQFYPPPTHEPYLPLLSQPQGVTALSLVFIAPAHEGMARLSWPGWLVSTEVNVPHRELNPDTVTHLSTNRARRWLTSLIEANALTTATDHQPNRGMPAQKKDQLAGNAYRVYTTRLLVMAPTFWVHSVKMHHKRNVQLVSHTEDVGS